MKDPAQYIRAAQPPESADAGPSTEPIFVSGPVSPEPEPRNRESESRSRQPRGSALQGWRGAGWLACGFAGCLAILWFIFLGPGELGSKADWFFGAVVLVVVMVTMWQTLNIQRQAKQEALEAAERLRRELAAAEERSALDLASAQALHRAEMEAQRELARVERRYLLEQQQKQAMVDVSRVVSAHTRVLATLWNQGASVLRIEDRDERERAMNPIFEQIGQVVNDFSLEFTNANLLIKDDDLHEALDRVNEAVLMAIRVAEDVHVAVIEGRALKPNPIPDAQRLMNERAAEARRLAWDLLRTSLDGG